MNYHLQKIDGKESPWQEKNGWIPFKGVKENDKSYLCFYNFTSIPQHLQSPSRPLSVLLKLVCLKDRLNHFHIDLYKAIFLFY